MAMYTSRVHNLTKAENKRRANKAAGLMNKLSNFALLRPEDPGYEKAQMTPAQIQATQIVLKKLVPDLSAIEQTNKDPRDNLTEEQILANLKLMIESSPDIAHKLRQLLIPRDASAPDMDLDERLAPPPAPSAYWLMGDQEIDVRTMGELRAMTIGLPDDVRLTNDDGDTLSVRMGSSLVIDVYEQEEQRYETA